ncbi:MAG: nucleotide pyrophosphohydrolase [Candidatus Komeilibacteria bacterium CG10_big_fil_rev_8_21_14_0_10_41_13]|uniref:Nucleotide pyrophosphohydrolase n=1 Tax=Candidatus Komeilibacteria bacterium CG10_big_fil_rev_8_21_14_0_10_41_13 TaxID=1974476 RepID=A0A2M6WBY4_9BACT|nr:MAG: nucleotide pyrophosphohydrolase [Candidatus Komeilibacteria bacterium CG10_big_fil_rev_8_21_14_0_10_41_13]
MPLKDLQKQVDDWTGQYRPQYWPPHENLARLAEEVGELAREINHLYGQKKKKASEPEGDLGQEIVDVLFTLICLANSHDLDLDKEWQKLVAEKLNLRDKDRYDRK